MVSLPDWEEGNYSTAELGVEEGIIIFLLEKLTQVILVLVFVPFLFFYLFYAKNHLEDGTTSKTLFSHIVFQCIVFAYPNTDPA